MKLLTSVLPPGTRILPAGWWFTLLVFSAVAGLEVVGRLYTSNDVHDALAAFLLLGVGIAVAARHRRSPLAWVRAAMHWAKRLGALAAWLRYDHGIDLRCSPPLPRRTGGA